MDLVRATQPAQEPVSLDTARAWLRIPADITIENPLIQSLISDAREYVENYIGTPVALAEFIVQADGFGDQIELPATTTEVLSVNYVNDSGAETALDPGAYAFFAAHPQRAFLSGAYGTSWPVARDVTDAVRVRVRAGWLSADVVPAPIKTAMHLLIAHLFHNREAVGANNLAEMPLGVAARLNPYRVGLGV